MNDIVGIDVFSADSTNLARTPSTWVRNWRHGSDKCRVHCGHDLHRRRLRPTNLNASQLASGTVPINRIREYHCDEHQCWNAECHRSRIYEYDSLYNQRWNHKQRRYHNQLFNRSKHGHKYHRRKALGWHAGWWNIQWRFFVSRSSTQGALWLGSDGSFYFS